MNCILFVIDGLGMWTNNGISTFGLLEEKYKINSDDDFPLLTKLGFNHAKKGEGNLLFQQSTGVGSLEGHREMLGYVSTDDYISLDNGLSPEIIKQLNNRFGFSCVCNIQGRGANIIPRFWEEHIIQRLPILYTGYDYTVSIAIKRGMINQEVLYNYAKELFILLHNRGYNIRKIIAREYDNPVNKISEKEFFCPRNFYSVVQDMGFTRIIVNNKIQDIFSFPNADVFNSDTDETSFHMFKSIYPLANDSLFFINLPDFDRNAHMGNMSGCYKTLKLIDSHLTEIVSSMNYQDYLIITSDHGVEYKDSNLSTSHLKECVLFLVSTFQKVFYHPGIQIGHDFILKTLTAITSKIDLNTLDFYEVENN